MKNIQYLKAIVFLAAFLLFQIELIVSKIFLPEFGGSYLVWGACVVFFQGVLLLGYIYSHLITRKFRIARYNFIHACFMLLPFLFFPGRYLSPAYSHPGIPLVFDIFWQLLYGIGPVFFILATLSIISQVWLSSSELPERLNPYALYAVSNAGAFISLLVYPFVFERFFDLRTQINIWRAGYVLLAVLYVLAARKITCARSDGYRGRMFAEGLIFRRFEFDSRAKAALTWLLFAAAGSICFLAVTNIITYEVAPCPLLWIIPLCVYLLSFTLNFKEKPFCPRWITDKFHLWLGFSVLFFFITKMRVLPFIMEVAAYSVSLFAICMFCQYKLFQGRPKEPQRLTLFYLVISLGSFTGGLLVTWVAPLAFQQMNEYLLGLFVAAWALTVSEKMEAVKWHSWRMILYVSVLIMAWPAVFKSYNIWGLILIAVIFKAAYSRLKENPRALALSVFSILAVSFFTEPLWSWSGRYIYALRNYYGIYKVVEKGGALYLYNGTTLHGAQYVIPGIRNTPLSYYHRDTPLGKLFLSGYFETGSVGVVGLGVGTISAYAKPGQEMEFYELDKDAYRVADLCFSYLQESKAKINHVFGDARVSLRNLPDARYDLLIIDAFSGDSVPVHLLTIEAISEYRRHLKQGGVVLFHVSNRYLDLVPVLFSNARSLKAYAVLDRNKKKGKALLGTLWVALTWDENSRQILISKLNWRNQGPDLKVKKIRPWTDGYSNLLSVFELKKILDSLKTFQPFDW